MRKIYALEISEHYLPALINDDYSGLDESDELLLRNFLSKNDLTHYNFSLEDGEHFFALCEVSSLKANCHSLIAWYNEPREY